MKHPQRIAFGMVVLLTMGCGGNSPTAPSAASSTPPVTTPVPPTPAIGGLTGYVRERGTTASIAIANARVEVLDTASGMLTGNFVLTDANGSYHFPGLAGGVSFRASKSGYEGDPRRVQLSQTQTLDFNIMPLSRKPARESISAGQTRAAIVSADDDTCGGMFFRSPCKRFRLAVRGTEGLSVQLRWGTADDLDLELWRDDTFIIASLTCQSCGVGASEEAFTRTVAPGEYELRVTDFFPDAGSSTPFELTVGRSN